MNVPLIEVTKNEALTKLEDYKSLNQSQKTREDERLQSLYQAVSKGARVINVANAFKFAGLNEKGQPKLAIARADWKTVWFHPGRVLDFSSRWNHSRLVEGSGSFSDTQSLNRAAYQKTICLPSQTFLKELSTRNDLRSRVPHIPPKLRPTIHLRNFHILFEVDKWDEYPVDPYLLRRIDGHLFIVVGEWELTALEASLLSSMTGN